VPVAEKKKDRGGESQRGSFRSLGRITVFYVVFLSGLAILAIQFDWIGEALTGTGSEALAGQGGQGNEITQTMAGGVPVQGLGIFGWEGVAVGTLSLITALLIMIPVAWTYIIIKARGGYDQSVVHTLLILPIAVTGIVIIVQDSLALAFSLAGIVAAVRFRTTLEDTKDAVYVFLAIGVGLASGVHYLGIAIVLSVVFNVVNLVLWRMNFGNIYVDQLGRTSALGLGDVLAGPGSARTAVSIGDRSLLSAMRPEDVHEVAQKRARLEQYLDSVTDTGKERKAYSILLVHTRQVGDVQGAVEDVLKRAAVRWRLAEILPGKEDVSVLEYLVRPREGVPTGAILDAIRREGGDKIEAAELRSLEGLKKRATP
jgi:vacuolar-type H+-ATPase subunit F/Vma7